MTSRRDYTAFGEESVTPERAAGLGCAGQSGTRKGYTGYEKDTESGLDFAQARYYNPTHGRFTSVDPLTASATIRNPQTFNRYTYVLNSPYKFTDPLGLIPETTGACGNRCRNSDGGQSFGVFTDSDPFGSGNFLSESEQWETYEITTTTILSTTMVTGGQSATVTVTIVSRQYVTIDPNTGGEVRLPGIPPPPSLNVIVDVADVQGARTFTQAQKKTIKDVTQDIVEVALQKNVDPKIALALGVTESYLGVGSVDSANISKRTGQPFPHKLPDVNPLQLSAACPGCPPRARSGVENRRFNIAGAFDEFLNQLKRHGNQESAIKGFGADGLTPSQKGYKDKFFGFYNSIRSNYRTHQRCISGCR